jgi:hypothetical protein
VVAWIDNSPGNARRVNGNITATGFSVAAFVSWRGTHLSSRRRRRQRA